MSKHAIQCWNCGTWLNLDERNENDGDCIECGVELALDDYLGQAVEEIDQLRTELVALKAGQGEAVELSVWCESMPESNGKSNYTAILHRKGECISEGITLDRSEYPDRVRYEADRARFLIGELTDEPDILAYDADAHGGYTAPPASADCEFHGSDKAAASAAMTERDELRAQVEAMRAIDAHAVAAKVREALDRKACPDAWMVIAYEAAVAALQAKP